MNFLTNHLGPLPVWAYLLIVVVGGIVVFIWFKHYQSSQNNSQATSTSGVAGASAAYNPLNPTNDPNIDPNTGVPYQLEEAINPNTGIPFYYSQFGIPGPTPSPPPPVPSPNPGPPPAPGADQGFVYKGPRPPQPKPPAAPGADSGFIYGGGTGQPYYTFTPNATTGQTLPLSSAAQQIYGVNGTQATNQATQNLINANPSLAGKPPNFQPQPGTRIVIPNR